MESEASIISPRGNTRFIGHQLAERAMLETFSSGRLPNAWLISGSRGVGKATLAYRFAKFLLTNKLPESQIDGLFGDELATQVPESLGVDHDNPVISRILAGSHGDFLVIDTENLDEDKVRKEISVDEVRKVNEFLSLTPSEADMRVVIIDSVDQMNRNAANAILKILEEPPQNSIILMVCHNPGKLLPTIKSRCRQLKLSMLSEDEVENVVRSAVPEISDKDCADIALLSGGAPGLALEIYDKSGIELYKEIVELFQSLPDKESLSIDELSDKVEGKAYRENWDMVSYLLQYFISTIVRTGVNDNQPAEIVSGESELKRGLINQCSIAKWADLWEETGRMAVEADYANLGKKHALITIYNRICNEVA